MKYKLIEDPRRDYLTFKDPYLEKDVDNFYKVCQLHRLQYENPTKMHPLDYFVGTEFKYQCPNDLTSTYLKYPQYYLQYRHPLVLPQCLERTTRFPDLPERCLRGKYS